MAKLQPYIGGQNYRTVRQHDTTQVLDRLTGQLAGVGQAAARARSV